MGTKIEWTDESWNFLGGCTPCSPGCKNCAAARQAAGRLKNHPLYKGLTKNGQWTGEVRLCTDIGRADILEKPLHWRRPRMIFPSFMGDLFHPSMPFEFIEKVLRVIEQCSQHAFQILTKWPEIAYDFFGGTSGAGLSAPPLKNLWLGVTAENQKCADERIPILLQMPAAVRFVSIEPVLEPIIFTRGLWSIPPHAIGKLDWGILGCESGPKRRPCPDVRGIVGQFYAAQIPLFVKQLSINGKVSHNPEEWPEDLRIREYPKRGE